MPIDQKFSELEDDERKQALDYIRARWAQYASATREVRKDSATFVATINAGGAATLLAFAGAAYSTNKELLSSAPLRFSLFFFVIGITLTATSHAIESARLNSLFEIWRDGVKKLYGDTLSLNKLIEDDIARSGRHQGAAERFITAALFCFAIGAIFGLCLLFGAR
jgi:hypothetical protein